MKSCPFCGAEAAIVSWDLGDSPVLYYRVQCLGPKRHALDQWDDTEEEAELSWDERPSIKL